MKRASKPKRTKKPYWYIRFVGECPVCGRDMGYRERREGHRPPESQRYVVLPLNQCYDGCMER